MSSSRDSEPPSEDVTVADGATVAEGPGSHEADPAPEVGSLVGRYVVVGAIGEGGMGRVVRAYDPKLHREIALKLLRSRGDEEARSRIVREAQAMAKLTHPNVVAVYDVDTHEGRPFIAMEYVEGRTLEGWIADGARPWHEVIDVFCAAARGVAEAHRAGLVHRDFKPSNVLIVEGELGRVRRVQVTDFGLARGVEHVDSNVPPPILDSAGDTLTLAGSILGTPAYMAPEQHAGQMVDARSDQYAFCVALWEALAGQRPFGGPDLAKAKREPERLEFPEGRAVPPFVRKALRRGLRVSPDERFGSMEELIAELSQSGPRTRLRWAVAGGVVVVAGTLGGWQIWEAARRSECASTGRSIAALYDDAARERIEARFFDTGSPLAEETVARLRPRLDRYIEQWSDLRTQTCIVAEVEGGDAQTHRLAVECLEERRAEFEGVVAAFESADATTVAYAVSSVAGLPPLSNCLDANWLHRSMSLPDDDGLREAVLAKRKELAAIDAMIRAGRYDDAESAIGVVRKGVEELGFAPLIARTKTIQADLAGDRGDNARARELLESAFHLAMRERADDIALSAAISMIFSSTYGDVDLDVGKMWVSLAETLLERTDNADDLLAASYENNRAVLLHELNEYEEALAGHRRSIALHRAAAIGDDPGLAASYNNIGSIYYDMKDLDAARENFERAVEIRERLLGAAHPKLALPLKNLGELEYDDRAYEDALMYLENARDIYVDTWGADHQFVSSMHTKIGRIYYARGQYDVALWHHQLALEIAESRLGPMDPLIADLLDNVGQTYNRLGLHEEALPCYERSLRIDEARDGNQDVSLAFTTMLVGENLYLRGQFEPALAELERALTLAQGGGSSVGNIASMQFHIAQVLWLDPTQRRRAVELARQSVENYERGGPWNDIWKTEVQGWLDDRKGS